MSAANTTTTASSGIAIDSTSAESKAFFNTLSEVLDGISIAVGCIVIVAVILIRIYRPQLGQTITVRLSGWIALADILVCSIQNSQIGGFVKEPAWAAPYYMWGSQYVWQLLGEVYCAIVIVLVLVKLFRLRNYQKEQSSVRNQNQTDSADQHARSGRRITFVMLRIVWYPVIPIITQTWLIVMNSVPPPHNLPYININNSMYMKVVTDVRKCDKTNYANGASFSLVMSALQGILNGIVFCLNPATYALWQEWRNKQTEMPFSPRSSRHNRGSFDDSAPWLKLQEPTSNSHIETGNYEMYKPNKPGIPADW
ncbi:hypothetical protein INT43_002965 [Umbelopsis isabellina]|uniref:Uncharacterized protein n=1 Tax=Mortierella isabellina TaxID=91625 RepID=A0A8H7PCG7_MORIS|nr:hypothetical protein INT43_002965 [Umbelopsis isabellina]